MFTVPILITVLDTVEVTPFFQFFFVKHPDRLGFMGPTYVVGIWVIIYYRQVFLPLGFAWLCEMWYRILLIGCLRLSLGCDTWFTISYANTLVSSDDY